MLVAFFGLPALAWGQASQHALRFYGTGTGQQDRVRIPIDDNGPGPDASAPCDVGSGDFSLDFWLRGRISDNGSTNTGGDNEALDFSWINGNIIVDRDIFGGSDADWGISIRGGFVSFGTGRGSPPGDLEHTLEGNVNVLTETWHHVAVTRDGATGIKRIYVDGQIDFAGSPGASVADLSYPDGGVAGQMTPWGPFIVLAAEKHDAGPEYPSFSGYIDELRVWNISLSHSEIQNVFNRVISPNTAGLVACYRFEEGAGTIVTDSSLASSPDGLLIAGSSGNGEWVSYSSNSENTAPVSAPATPVPAASEWSAAMIALCMLACGAILLRRTSAHRA